MLKKLKRKFILITMTFITLILVCVITLLCLASYQRTKNDINNSLNFALYKYDDHLTLELDYSTKNLQNDNDPPSKHEFIYNHH